MKRFLPGLMIGLSVIGLACEVHSQATNDNPLPPNVANQPAPDTMGGPPATEAQAKELVLHRSESTATRRPSA